MVTAQTAWKRFLLVCLVVCAALVGNNFAGHAVAEINTQEARTTAARAAMLERTLTFARTHLNPAITSRPDPSPIETR